MFYESNYYIHIIIKPSLSSHIVILVIVGELDEVGSVVVMDRVPEIGFLGRYPESAEKYI